MEVIKVPKEYEIHIVLSVSESRRFLDRLNDLDIDGGLLDQIRFALIAIEDGRK